MLTACKLLFLSSKPERRKIDVIEVSHFYAFSRTGIVLRKTRNNNFAQKACLSLFATTCKSKLKQNNGVHKTEVCQYETPVRICMFLLRFSKTHELWSSKANWHLRFSLPPIILADLLGNRTLLTRIQKVMVCDLWLVDFDPFCVFLCFKVRCLWS